MSLTECKCPMSIKLLGDGCEVCNPEFAAGVKAENEAEAAKLCSCGDPSAQGVFHRHDDPCYIVVKEASQPCARCAEQAAEIERLKRSNLNLVSAIKKADDCMSKGNRNAALTAVRTAASIASPSYQACVMRSDEIERLTKELETERMRLAACGVVALANTPESAPKAREMLPEYKSAYCDDVAQVVDSEMKLRTENEQQSEQLVALAETVQKVREVLKELESAMSNRASCASYLQVIQEALALTDQSASVINRIKAQGMLEAAELHNSDDVLAPVGNSYWGEAKQEGWIEGTAAYRDAIRVRAAELEGK